MQVCMRTTDSDTMPQMSMYGMDSNQRHLNDARWLDGLARNARKSSPSPPRQVAQACAFGALPGLNEADRSKSAGAGMGDAWKLPHELAELIEDNRVLIVS